MGVGQSSELQKLQQRQQALENQRQQQPHPPQTAVPVSEENICQFVEKLCELGFSNNLDRSTIVTALSGNAHNFELAINRLLVGGKLTASNNVATPDSKQFFIRLRDMGFNNLTMNEATEVLRKYRFNHEHALNHILQEMHESNAATPAPQTNLKRGADSNPQHNLSSSKMRRTDAGDSAPPPAGDSAAFDQVVALIEGKLNSTSSNSASDHVAHLKQSLCHALAISPSLLSLKEVAPAFERSCICLKRLSPVLTSPVLKHMISCLPEVLVLLRHRTQCVMSSHTASSSYQQLQLLGESAEKHFAAGEVNHSVKMYMELAAALLTLLGASNTDLATDLATKKRQEEVDHAIRETCAKCKQRVKQVVIGLKEFQKRKDECREKKAALDSKILHQHQRLMQAENSVGTPPAPLSVATICLDLLQSPDPAIKESLTSRSNLFHTEAEVDRLLEISSKQQGYLDSIFALFDAVSSEVRVCVHCTSSHSTEDHERALGMLIGVIPGLAAGLRQQLEFIAEKLEKGKLKLEEKEVELEEHLRVFASAAPAEQQDLEKRVKEMKTIIQKSERSFIHSVQAQAQLWGPVFTSLPKKSQLDLAGCIIAGRDLWHRVGFVNKHDLGKQVEEFIAKCTSALQQQQHMQTRAQQQVQEDKDDEKERQQQQAQEDRDDEKEGQQQQVQEDRDDEKGMQLSSNSVKQRTPHPQVQLQQPQNKPTLAVGSRVFTLFEDQIQQGAPSRSWYEGVILNVNKQQQHHISEAKYLYDIRYCDGDVKRGVGSAQLHVGHLDPTWVKDGTTIHRISPEDS